MHIIRIEPSELMSQAVIHGNTIFLSGQVDAIGKNFDSQMNSVLEKIETILAKAGSDKSDILSAKIWLANISDYAAMNDIWRSWIDNSHPPTRATCEAKLAAPNYLVEIAVVAARRSKN